MAKERKFVICKNCGTIAGMIHDAGIPLRCCNGVMEEMIPNTSDGASEKHIPVVEKNGTHLTVRVGSAAHPMTAEHSIDWVYLQTEKGGQRKKLAPAEAPIAQFIVTEDDRPLVAYAYCNLHGFWKSENIK